MKFFSKYLSLAAVAVAAGASLTSCQNDFDLPPIDEPKATMEANTTISALKTQYWQDDQNYFLTVGTNAEGADVIVRGRVVSSDATGNIYKSLVIQDETGALAFSINQTGLICSRWAAMASTTERRRYRSWITRCSRAIPNLTASPSPNISILTRARHVLQTALCTVW